MLKHRRFEHLKDILLVLFYGHRGFSWALSRSWLKLAMTAAAAETTFTTVVDSRSDGREGGRGGWRRECDGRGKEEEEARPFRSPPTCSWRAAAAGRQGKIYLGPIAVAELVSISVEALEVHSINLE